MEAGPAVIHQFLMTLEILIDYLSAFEAIEDFRGNV
jgi:hypothetical protein